MEEQRVLTLKYRSKRVAEIPAMELMLHVKGLVSKIVVITGWMVPDSEEYAHILNDQLAKLLVDEYSMANFDEIEYAMRVYGTHIKDWGKAMNLALISEAIDSYLSHRSALSSLEADAAKPETPKHDKVTEVVDWSNEYEKLRAGQYEGQFADLIPYSAIYDWALREGKFAVSNGEKWEALEFAREKEVSRLSLKKEAFQATPDERADLERIKCVDWRKDARATGLLIGEAKKSLLLTKIKEDAENTQA